jgi:rhodanese-related sulfurtransferase
LSYDLIDVHTAHSIIEDYQIVLDVRSSGDYNMSHLDNAVSMPFELIEVRLDELAGLEHMEILVYCKSGVTSQLAAETLVINGFTKVSSMIGGILEWLEAGYSIWTASHYVSIGPGSSMNSEPLISFLETLSIPTSNCSHQDSNSTLDISSVVIEQNETHSVQLMTIELNDTMFEYTVTTTRIWECTETSQFQNESVVLMSIKTVFSDKEMQVYQLSYWIDHINYTFQLDTTLTPSDEHSYNKSSTNVVFKPVDSPEITSIEMLEFKTPRTLSQIYNNIAHAVKQIGKEYDRSNDDYLRTLGNRYRIIYTETKSLSLLVKTYLSQYDLEIIDSVAVVIDACTWYCWGNNWSDCYGVVTEITMACLALAFVGCMAVPPLFPTCMGSAFVFCGELDLFLAMACLAMAFVYCCTGPPGCPILTVFDGNEYVSEGLLDIHSEEDVVRSFHLNSIPSNVDGRYLMKLTEHYQTRSHLDRIRLFARLNDGYLVEIALISAIHSAEGDVLYELGLSDDLRIDLLGANHNYGNSQYIDLQFSVPDNFSALHFILVLEGFNGDTKD